MLNLDSQIKWRNRQVALREAYGHPTPPFASSFKLYQLARLIYEGTSGRKSIRNKRILPSSYEDNDIKINTKIKLHHQQTMSRITQSKSSRACSDGLARRSQLYSNSKPLTNVLPQKMPPEGDNNIKNHRRKLPGAIRLVQQMAALTLLLTTIYLPLKSHCQTTTSTTDELSTSLTTTEFTTKLTSEWLSEDSISIPSNNTVNKVRPVNFTLVDEIFSTVLDDDEVIKRWRNMDTQIQDGMKSILKMVFPLIVSTSQDAKVSGECSGGILKWILSLRNLRSWAIKMLDATGKPNSGILEGSLTMFGNYKQCLSVRAPDEDEIEVTDQFEEYFRGQFCVLHLKPWMPAKPRFYNLNSSIEFLLRKNYKYYEKTLYDELAELAFAFNFMDIRIDLCVPSTCTVADIQRVAELLSKKLEMRAKVMRCDIASRDTNRFQYLDSVTCYWLAIPVCLIIISLLSSLVAPLLKHAENDRKAKLIKIFKNLSFIEALKDRLREPNKTTNDSVVAEMSQQFSCTDSIKPAALYGLRSLFVFWFIIVQMTVELNYQYLRESLSLRNMIISYWPFQIIINSVLLFDSIILITAFIYSYTCLESTLKDLIAYIVDKYIRFILPIVTMIAITMLTPILAIESPIWRNFIEDQSIVCKSNGYLNLIFLQNFISYDKICLPHTWLFCVELQLIVLTIPLLLLFKKSFLKTEDSIIINLNLIENEEKKLNRKISLLRFSFNNLIKSKAGLLSAFLLLAGLLTNFLIVYINQLPPSWFYTYPDVIQKNYYFGFYIIKTWTHLSVFLIGLVAGHLCRVTLQLHHLKMRRPSNESDSQLSQDTSTYSTGDKSSQLTSSRSHISTSTITILETSGQQSDNIRRDGRNQKSLPESILNGSIHITAMICMLATIFSTYNWSTQQNPSTLVAAFYDALSRLIWSISLGWLIIQLCLPNKDTQKYSRVTIVLRHHVCIALGRLSFLAYLIAPYVNTFVLAVQEQALFPSLFILFHIIVGNIVITYILAFIIAILIEQPVRRLFSCLVLGGKFRKRRGSLTMFTSSLNK